MYPQIDGKDILLNTHIEKAPINTKEGALYLSEDDCLILLFEDASKSCCRMIMKDFGLNKEIWSLRLQKINDKWIFFDEPKLRK